MVCSRFNLCNNSSIFWLSETTKTLLGFALFTQGISLWSDVSQRVYKWDRDRLRRIWDYYNIINYNFVCKKLFHPIEIVNLQTFTTSTKWLLEVVIKALEDESEMSHKSFQQGWGCFFGSKFGQTKLWFHGLW